MDRRALLPPLPQLLAFEATARVSSVARAAEELALPTSYVNKQLQALEKTLGISLFDRHRSQVFLTEPGKRYAKEITEALQQIRTATVQALSSDVGGGSLVIGVLPTFAAKWLQPRLPDFYAQHPEILVSLRPHIGPANFSATGLDAVISIVEHDTPGTRYIALMEEDLVPVIGVSDARAGTYPSIESLREGLLFRMSSRPDTWNDWFKAQGLDNEKLRLGPTLATVSQIVQAVASGIGIGLLPRVLIQDELANGKLVMPFNAKPMKPYTYHLVAPSVSRNYKPLTVFIEWLRAQSNYSPTQQVSEGCVPV